MTALRLGTRGSRLALWQASWVARTLAALHPHGQVELVILRTTGDAVVDRPIAAVGATGVFVKELEDALLRGAIDFAVHSLKDMETRLPEGLVLAAVPERGPVEDGLVAAAPVTLGTLPEGARIATGSPRRAALLRARRPDLVQVGVRGNVPTRIGKILAGEADATVLARAGLHRLELTEHLREVFDAAAFPPAPGQGALGVQCRADDAATREALSLLNHRPTRAAVDAERAFLRTLGSGCHLAAGAWARAGERPGTLVMDGFVGSARGVELHRARREGSADEAELLGKGLADEIVSRSSDALLAELREGNHPRGGAA